MRSFFLGVLFAAAISTDLTAQPRGAGEVPVVHMPSRVYLDAFALPGPGDSALVVAGFRIPNDRLVFMRHTEGVSDRLFRAFVSVTVEVYQADRLVEEKVWRSESFASEYDETVDPKRSTVGSMTFSLPPGDYGVGIRLNDLNTERTISTPRRRISVPDFSTTVVGRAVLVDTVVITDLVRYVTFLNLGGDARFGDHLKAVVPVAFAPSPVATDLKWSLRKLDPEVVRDEMKDRRERLRSDRGSDSERDIPELEPRMMMAGGIVIDSGSVSFESFLAISPLTEADVHSERITLAAPSSSGTTDFLVPIDLNGKRLENAAYVLDVVLKGAGETARSSTRFSSHWPDMPLSLLDIDGAIKKMRFILDKSAIDELKRGSREDKINKFKAFWQERDPTPETAYNELMVEYFRRVDHAAVEYRTGPGTMPDGLETDRARIYIVHGPPDQVSRAFPEGGGVLETWDYADGKSFTFEAASSVDAFHIVKEG